MRFMLILPVAISIVCSGIQAQPGWNWPEDQKLAQEKNALYSDVLKTETTNLQSAIAPHTWLVVYGTHELIIAIKDVLI